MRSVLKLSLLAGCMAVGQLSAQDAPGTRVLKPSAEVIEEVAELAIDQAEARDLYDRAGRPRIMLFLDRQLLDILSEWESLARTVDSREMTASSSSMGEGSPSCTFLIQRISNASGCTYRRSRSIETRTDPSDQQLGLARTSAINRGGFEAGFQSYLINHGISLVDRELTLRRASRDAGRSGNAAQEFYDLEIDALDEYADYILEILLIPDQDAELSLSYRINVMQVETGQLVASIQSSGEQGFTPQVTERWVTTDSGYEKVVEMLLPSFTPYDTGEQVAEDVLLSMMNFWRYQ